MDLSNVENLNCYNAAITPYITYNYLAKIPDMLSLVIILPFKNHWPRIIMHYKG